MLAIRMQRTGRTGHASFRVIVQDAAKSPTSGKVVEQLGSYDPHTKAVALDKDRAKFFLTHGAQPSDRVAVLLKQEGVKLPSWVEARDKKKSAIRNPEKLRRNQPKDAKPAKVAPAEEEVLAEETPTEVAETTETTAPEAEITTEAEETETTESAPAETETTTDTPAEEPAAEAEKPVEPAA